MELTTINDRALKELITGTSQVELDFLAAKILLSTLRARVHVDSSPAMLSQAVKELKDLLARHQKLPMVQSDLQKLDGTRAAQGQVLFGIEETSAKIAEGRNLVLAGDRALLKQLPAGNWIGGTIPYFMATQGGIFTKEKIFVTELPSFASAVSVKTYTESTIASVYSDAPENGVSVVIIPGSSPLHLSFALNAPRYERFATRPLIGWISGTDVADIGKVAPEVISGQNKLGQKNAAVVMHVALPPDKQANISIVNIFNQGSGDAITFPEDGFHAVDAQINGTRRNFADYLAEKNIDTKLPLVADYSGAMINTSFQEVDKTRKRVGFYAPVFRGVEYKVAAPVADYVAAFESRLPRSAAGPITFSCNCILNYLYSSLEGKRTGQCHGTHHFRRDRLPVVESDSGVPHDSQSQSLTTGPCLGGARVPAHAPANRRSDRASGKEPRGRPAGRNRRRRGDEET